MRRSGGDEHRLMILEGFFQPQEFGNSAQLEATAPGFLPKGQGQNFQKTRGCDGAGAERDLGEGKRKNNSAGQDQGMQEKREKQRG